MNISLILGISSAAVATIATIAALTALRAVRRWRSECESLVGTVTALRRESELLASISVRTGRRVQRMMSEFSGVAERIDLVESRVAPGPQALDRAIELARRGVGSLLLEEQLGLCRGEADLVARLHGRGKLN